MVPHWALYNLVKIWCRPTTWPNGHPTVAEYRGWRSGGIAMLDTAPSYGLSENLIGDASLHDFDVVTKISGFSASDLKKKIAYELGNNSTSCNDAAPIIWATTA